MLRTVPGRKASVVWPRGPRLSGVIDALSGKTNRGPTHFWRRTVGGRGAQGPDVVCGGWLRGVGASDRVRTRSRRIARKGVTGMWKVRAGQAGSRGRPGPRGRGARAVAA